MPRVQVARNGAELILTPSQITLNPGESIQWDFPQLDNNELAYIRFSSPEFPLGPFEYLGPSGSHVVGIGNNGSAQTYSYTAMILNDQGQVAISDGTASVDNSSADVDTSPDASIFFNNGQLHVLPNPLKLQPGRTAFWYITDLPPNTFVAFQFDVQSPKNPMVGPFSFFSVSRGLGTALLAIGMNFQAASPDNVTYHVTLRDADGNVIGGDDPVIEPLGDPPGSGGH